jgi:hypothetical protein
MKITTKHILVAGAAAAIGYLVWKNRNTKETVTDAENPLPSDVPKKFMGYDPTMTDPNYYSKERQEKRAKAIKDCDMIMSISRFSSGTNILKFREDCINKKLKK